MNVEYMRTAKKSYMIVKEADFPFEQYELKMILQNEIPCLLAFQTILADGKAEYWYDVSGMQSLKTRFMMEAVDGKQLRFLLEKLMEMKSAMEEYLLDEANLLFSADMIYLDHSGGRVRFCYIPGLGSRPVSDSFGQNAPGVKELFEELLQHLNHADPVAVRMGYEMYERAARAPFVLQDCMECLHIGESIAAEAPDISIAEQEVRWRDAAAQAREPETNIEEMEFLFEEPESKEGHRRKREKQKRHNRRKEPEEEELLFALRPEPPGHPEPLSVAEQIGLTELISEEDAGARAWELVYKGEGMESDLTLFDFPFLVGTDARRVSGVLRARTVSRVHAKLYLREEKLYVEDFNSTNGTYLNQRLLPMNTPAELKEGDRIVFATEEFAVCCRRH